MSQAQNLVMLSDQMVRNIRKLTQYGARRHVIKEFLHEEQVRYSEYTGICKRLGMEPAFKNGLMPTSLTRYFRQRDARLQSTYIVSTYLKLLAAGVSSNTAIVRSYDALRATFDHGTEFDVNDTYFLVRWLHAREVHLETCEKCGAQVLVKSLERIDREKSECPTCWLMGRCERATNPQHLRVAARAAKRRLKVA